MIAVPVTAVDIGASIDSPPPQYDPMDWWLGEEITFSGSAYGGIPPYYPTWSFCLFASNCSLLFGWNWNEVVTYTDTGTHMIYFLVIDDDENQYYDNFTINIKMADIVSPSTETSWGYNTTITFTGIGYSDEATINYKWDFGDGNLASGTEISGDEFTTDHKYLSSGWFTVSLNVSDGDDTDSTAINILIVNTEDLIFTCSMKVNGCDVDEDELLRFPTVDNTHAIGPESIEPGYSNYNYSVCCLTSQLHAAVDTENPGSGSTYAVLLNDSFSRVAGSHLMPDDINVSDSIYYYLDSTMGIGSICERIAGNCSSLDGNKTCVFEYIEQGVPLAGSHFYNCTPEKEPMTTDGRMCCAVTEDCTNNYDDDSNTWRDTADNNFETEDFSCPAETVCGISNQLELAECSWMNAYCDEDDYCDFRGLGIPNKYDPESFFPPVPEGYVVMDYYNESCLYLQDELGDYYLRFSSPANCPMPPPFVAEYHKNADFNASMIAQGVNEFELYNRCRYLHCSKGIDANNPLPAFVPDMENNSYLTRHVCGIGSYWQPILVEETGVCINTDECYVPSNPLGFNCHFNYETQFVSWFGDYNNTENLDCFDTQTETISACCPVYHAGTNTYDYVDVEYYMVP